MLRTTQEVYKLNGILNGTQVLYFILSAVARLVPFFAPKCVLT